MTEQQQHTEVSAHPHPKCHDCGLFFKCESLPPCASTLPATPPEQEYELIGTIFEPNDAGGNAAIPIIVKLPPSSHPAPAAEHAMIYDAEHPNGITFPEYANAIRKDVIYELLKDLGYGCPGGEPTLICNVCGVDKYCQELRREGEPR